MVNEFENKQECLDENVENVNQTENIAVSEEVKPENTLDNTATEETSEQLQNIGSDGEQNLLNNDEEQKLEEEFDLPKLEEEIPDYSELNREEILNRVRELVTMSDNMQSIKKHIDILKSLFYKIQKIEFDKIREELKEKAGEDAEIEMPKDSLEAYLKELLSDYRNKKAEQIAAIEKGKEKNLAAKKDIIEKIKSLANGEESLNKTFVEFKNLQQQWSEIGNVPAGEADGLWKTYQLQIEIFYNQIKINKELRDLDQKRNLEDKLVLCEKAEELLLMTDIIAAYRELQDIHERWKEYGPVPLDKKEEIWDRFSATSKKIRQAYQEHFESLKAERNANLEQKTLLCEKAEEICNRETPTTGKAWGSLSDEILDLQKKWKEIGTVPREVNAEIYERFRAACNKFFNAKKEFFDNITEDLNNNYQKKLDLCVSAESIKELTDWKKTTEMFLDLQRKWKAVGPVPRKQSDEIWTRFRAACDHFFNMKSEFYKNIGTEHEENKLKKEALIEEIKNFEPAEDHKQNIESIKSFQTRWTEIGYVASSQKDKLYAEYKKAVNSIYEKLNINKHSLDLSNFNAKVDVYKETGEIKELVKERSAIMRQIQELKASILQMENNMGFFSSGSDSIIKDFKRKIAKVEDEIKILQQKKKSLDVAEREIKNKNTTDEQDA